MKAVILIGHGGIPKDIPRDIVGEFKRLETAREAKKSLEMSDREAELDKKIREWPRNEKNDPYKYGFESIVNALKQKMAPLRVEGAYNEFCAPRIDDTIEKLVAEGAKEITLATIMITRGGNHSEFEIPMIVEDESRKHPGVKIKYAWPYAEAEIAEFLAAHLQRA